MEGFTRALGVRCPFCHVARKANRRDLDFVSDQKVEKETARGMLKMVARREQEPGQDEAARRQAPRAGAVHHLPPRAAAPDDAGGRAELGVRERRDRQHRVRYSLLATLLRSGSYDFASAA